MPQIIVEEKFCGVRACVVLRCDGLLAKIAGHVIRRFCGMSLAYVSKRVSDTVKHLLRPPVFRDHLVGSSFAIEFLTSVQRPPLYKDHSVGSQKLLCY